MKIASHWPIIFLYEGLDSYKEGKLEHSEFLFERVQKLALQLQ